MNRILSALLALAVLFGARACVARGEATKISMPDLGGFESALQGEAVTADTIIKLSLAGADIQGNGAAVEGSEILISEPGEYLLSGEWRGTLIVDVEKDKKVTLNLNGVSLRGDAGAAVWVKRASKNVTFYLCKGSVNLIEDAETYTYADDLEDIPSAAVYSKADLKFKGEGALYVSARAGKGIQSKDDIEIESGEIRVSASDDGIRGKDSVVVSGGALYIVAGADGIRANNDENPAKGYIEFSGGAAYIKSAQDALQAETTLTVSGGTLVLITGGGSVNASSGDTAPGWGMWGGGGWRGRRDSPEGGQPDAQQAGTQTSDSAKGLKAGVSVTITGARVSIDSSDDAIHSDGEIQIQGGEIYIESGDDGIHADTLLNISGADINIVKSYEGIESADIRVSGGEIRVTASDDGLNAAGGADGSSVDGRAGQNWGRGMFERSTGSISITGGYICVNASGDGIDSNGAVTMTGGTVIVYGPVNRGNGALDYSSAFDMSGGTLLAVGASGMAQSVTGDGVGVLAFTCRMEANEIMSISGADGVEAIAFAAPKSYDSVILASDTISPGEYTVYVSGAHTGEIIDGVYAQGAYTPGEKLGAVSAR